MIILGKNSDDKGKQLEDITRFILGEQGYKNLVCNCVTNGGQEIDVTGQFDMQSMSDTIPLKILCECKAYDSAIDMTAWLKFLGKIYVEEIESHNTVYGCFIALSGVNGNVSGSYESIKRTKNNIKLVTGENLFDLLKEHYKLVKKDSLADAVSSFVDKKIDRIELVYYENTVYWLVIFSDEDFTIFKANGKALTSEEYSKIDPLIKSAKISIRSFIDMKEEEFQKTRELITKKLFLQMLFLNSGTMKRKDVLENIQGSKIMLLDKTIILNEDEMSAYISQFKQYGWVDFNEENDEIKIVVDEDYSKIADLYSFLLSNRSVPVDVLGCEYYDKYINENLLKEILQRQEGIKIPPERIEEVLLLLKLSPTALCNFLFPNPDIVNHRKGQNNISERIEEDDTEHFITQLYVYLKGDFGNSSFIKYFLEKRQVIEIETIETIKLKSNQKLIQEGVLNERLIIGQMTEEYGGKYIFARVLKGASEPWEWMNTAAEQK